jgi:hypothetical protein
MRDGYHFRSSLFDIEPGEDAETNRGCYGRQAGRRSSSDYGLGVEVLLQQAERGKNVPAGTPGLLNNCPE